MAMISRASQRIGVSLLALAVITTVSACAAPEPSAPESAEFTMAVASVPDTMDPQLSTSTTPQNYLDYTAESLTQLQPDGSLAPLLATEWSYSEDGLALTFELREDVMFHDGTAFNADAAKQTFDRILDPEVRVPSRQNHAALTSVDVVDEYTIRMNLSTQDPMLPMVLSSTRYAILSPASIDAPGNSYDTVVSPVGTGPYEFVEYVTNQAIEFTRFKEYWGDEPYYDAVTLKIMPEAATREAELLAGTVDAIMAPPPSDLSSLETNPGVELVRGDTTRMIFYGINTQIPPFDDVRVRQALNHAVDKEALVDGVLFGTATPMSSSVPSSMAGYCESGAYAYDPDLARELLREAGVTELDIELLTPSGQYVQDAQVAQAVAGYLEAVGINAEIKTTDWATYLTWIRTAPEEQTSGPRVSLFGYAGNIPDASQMVNVWLEQSWAPASWNVGYYSNPEVESLMASALSTLDEAERSELLCEAQGIVLEEAPWIYLWTQQMVIATQSGVTGIEILPNEKFNTIGARPVG